MKKSFLFLLVIGLAGIAAGSSLFAQGSIPGPHQKSTLANGWQFVGTGGFSTGGIWDISLAFHPSGQPYVAFNDQGTLALHVMKFDGSAWADAGQISSSVIGAWVSLGIDAAGTPSLGFQHYNGMLIDKASVMHYNGTSWEFTGSSLFSAGNAYHTSLALNSGGTPYIVYQDAAYNNHGTAMKFDGSGWVNVGNPGFTSSFARNPVISISPSDIPYVAFGSIFGGNLGKATVMKFNGTGWELVGEEGFSAGIMDSISLAFDQEGKPWVAYSDGANSWKASVMRFDGNSWVNVGSPAFSAGAAGWTSIGFSQSGQAVVAFQDAANGYKASVMIYQNPEWIYLGTPGFTPDSSSVTALKFSPSGQPYVAFADWGNSGKASLMMYDGPLGVNGIQKPGLSIYPDPARDFLTIDPGTSGNNMNRLEIYNILGSQVMTLDLSGGTAHLNVESLPPGIYFVKAYGARASCTGRFTKK
jgi:hypothetical protein